MSTAPVEIRPWRECPFIRGKRYRVRRSFPALRDTFNAGEVLTFESDAWSRYDGITGYCFRQPGRDTLRVWDIGDDADILVWRELFEEVSDPATHNDASTPVNDRFGKQRSLYDAAYRLGEEIHNGRWSHIADLAIKPAPACEQIIEELQRRCPGFECPDYQRAIARGLQDSRRETTELR